MLVAPLGYKIFFTFEMPDGSRNGGLCNNPDSLSEVFELVQSLDGSNLVIEDRTTYLKATEPNKEG